MIFLLCALLLCAAQSAAFAATQRPQSTQPVEESEMPAVTVPTSSSGDFLLTVNSVGADVVRMQQRLIDLGYYTYRATGAFGSLTYRSVLAFQRNNDLLQDGKAGENMYSLLFSSKAKRSTLAAATQSKSTAEAGECVAWQTVQSLLKVDDVIQVTDFYTQKQWNMVCTDAQLGHADVECATLSDYTVYETPFGANAAGTKRPVIVQIGEKRIAASMQGQPHGSDAVAANVMTGHVCLYFDGSTLSTLGVQDAEHQKNIQIAAGAV